MIATGMVVALITYAAVLRYPRRRWGLTRVETVITNIIGLVCAFAVAIGFLALRGAFS